MTEDEYKKYIEIFFRGFQWHLVFFGKINGIVGFVVESTYHTGRRDYLVGCQPLKDCTREHGQHFCYMAPSNDNHFVASSHNYYYFKSRRNSIRQLKLALENEKRQPVPLSIL